MSVTFLMIPILTLTPPTPLPLSSPIRFSSRPLPLEHVSRQVDVGLGCLGTETSSRSSTGPDSSSSRQYTARSDLERVVECYLEGGRGGRRPLSLPFMNFELVRPVPPRVVRDEEKPRLAKEGTKQSRRTWNAMKKAKKAKQVIRVDQKLEAALGGLGW
ncbi:hypothetical protein JCM16303_006196 [Sporobolomyces ruberrimus]